MTGPCAGAASTAVTVNAAAVACWLHVLVLPTHLCTSLTLTAFVLAAVGAALVTLNGAC